MRKERPPCTERIPTGGSVSRPATSSECSESSGTFGNKGQSVPRASSRSFVSKVGLGWVDLEGPKYLLRRYDWRCRELKGKTHSGRRSNPDTTVSAQLPLSEHPPLEAGSTTLLCHRAGAHDHLEGHVAYPLRRHGVVSRDRSDYSVPALRPSAKSGAKIASTPCHVDAQATGRVAPLSGLRKRRFRTAGRPPLCPYSSTSCAPGNPDPGPGPVLFVGNKHIYIYINLFWRGVVWPMLTWDKHERALGEFSAKTSGVLCSSSQARVQMSSRCANP